MVVVLMGTDHDQLKTDSDDTIGEKILPWAIVGIVAHEEKFTIEVRLSRAPLAEADMLPWLEALIGHPMLYAPLPPFP